MQTIFTGLTQRTHGYRPADPEGSADITDDDLRTSFPTVLKRAGYYTGYFGKNHVNYEQGNEAAFNTMFNQWEHIHRDPYFKTLPDGTKRHCDEIIGDRSVAFLENRPENRPFMLFVSFNISHAEDSDHRPGIGHFPWPKAVDGLYEEVDPLQPRLKDPAIFDALPDFLKSSLNRTRYFWRWDTPEKYDTNMRALYRMLTGMDRIVGRVIQTLEKEGVADDTVVIYTADNGYYMGERGFAGKWSHYEQSLRTPLIIYDPRLPENQRGRVVDPMVLNLDMPSTILDLANLPVPDKYQGRSLVPLISDSRPLIPEQWRTSFFCEHHQYADFIPGWSGIHGKRYVYARYDRLNPPYEFLHDLKKDPDQLINFADDPEYATVLEQFRRQTDGEIKKLTRPETTAKQRASLN